MYSKKETALLKQEFWTALGIYLAPVLSAEGEKINWVNYKTGVKDTRFKMDAGNRDAWIGILLLHRDTGLQENYFNKLLPFKKTLEEIMQEEWEWKLHDRNEEGMIISRIYTRIENCSVLNRADWPALISFFKPRMIGLDLFWSNYKYALEDG